MHLVRINVKPRTQHGPSLATDSIDPTTGSIRHGHVVPTTSEITPRFTNPVWQLLPFTNRVSKL